MAMSDIYLFLRVGLAEGIMLLVTVMLRVVTAQTQAAPASRAASARSTDTSRLTPGSRMVTPTELLCGFHRRLVVADEQELHLLAHLA